MEFFLNGKEKQWIQLIQGILVVTVAQIGVNLKILSVTCVIMAVWYQLCILSEMLWIRGSDF